MKDRGKSSSRKLRRAIYYILYRMDPKKRQYKNSFVLQKCQTSNIGKQHRIYFPPNSRSTALQRRSARARNAPTSGPLSLWGSFRALGLWSLAPGSKAQGPRAPEPWAPPPMPPTWNLVRHNSVQGFLTMTLVAGKSFWIGILLLFNSPYPPRTNIYIYI